VGYAHADSAEQQEVLDGVREHHGLPTGSAASSLHQQVVNLTGGVAAPRNRPGRHMSWPAERLASGTLPSLRKQDPSTGEALFPAEKNVPRQRVRPQQRARPRQLGPQRVPPPPARAAEDQHRMKGSSSMKKTCKHKTRYCNW
jgi:hypothetical protein